jgi:DNA polymerase II small subunit
MNQQINKKDIVQNLLEKGILATPKLLAKIKTKEDLERILAPPKQDFRILKNITTIPKKITKNDIVSFYQNRYSKLRDIIQSQHNYNYISLNKIPTIGEFYVIIMVQNIHRKAGKFIIDVEDLTATRPIVFNQEQKLALNDVVVIKLQSRGRVLFGKQIIYPDTPLRKPKTGQGKLCFISDLHLDKAPVSDFIKFIDWFDHSPCSYLLIAGDIGSIHELEKTIQRTDKKIFLIPGNVDASYPGLPLKTKTKNIISLSNPSMINLGGLNILIIHNFCTEFLTKRYLGQSKYIFQEDPLVLTTLPDIIHCGHTHKPFIENYKSISILNSGSLLTDFRPVVVDFATRELKQVTDWNK